MKQLDEIRERIRKCNPILVERYGVEVSGVFGSYARQEAGENSDLDLLAEIVRPVGLLEFVGAEHYLSNLLGVKVDLVPRRSVRKELLPAILDELVEL